jgi:hypothetical protein
VSKIVIVIFGKRHEGKSTTARVLKKLLGDAKIEKFSSPIKKGLSAMFDIPLRDFEDPEKKEEEFCFGKTLRNLMTTLANEWGQDIVSPLLWCWLAMRRIESTTQKFIIIDDGRFPKTQGDWVENYCKTQGWKFYKLRVKRKTGHESLKKNPEDDKDRSETSLADSDMPTIRNTGTNLRQFKTNIENFYKFRLEPEF